MEGTYFFHLIFMRASIVQDGTIWDGDRTIAVYTSSFFSMRIYRKTPPIHIVINTNTKLAHHHNKHIYIYRYSQSM